MQAFWQPCFTEYLQLNSVVHNPICIISVIMTTKNPPSDDREKDIDSALKELKNICYLVVTKLYANMTQSKGIEYVYDFFENPISEDEADKHREKVKAEARAVRQEYFKALNAGDGS